MTKVTIHRQFTEYLMCKHKLQVQQVITKMMSVWMNCEHLNQSNQRGLNHSCMQKMIMRDLWVMITVTAVNATTINQTHIPLCPVIL